MIVSTTIASLIELFGRESEPDTVSAPIVAVVILPVVMVELVMVVVAKEDDPVKELVPVKILLFARYANEEVPASWFTERPETVAPGDKLKAVAIVSVPRLAVVIVELLIVVVENILEPVKLLSPVSVASVEVPLKLLKERPVTDEPVKLTEPFCTERLVDVTEVMAPFVPAKLPKKPLVDVTEVPVAEVNPNAPDRVPPMSGR